MPDSKHASSETSRGRWKRGDGGKFAGWRDVPATKRRFLVVYRMAVVQKIPYSDIADIMKMHKSQVYKIVELVKSSGILADG